MEKYILSFDGLYVTGVELPGEEECKVCVSFTHIKNEAKWFTENEIKMYSILSVMNREKCASKKYVVRYIGYLGDTYYVNRTETDGALDRAMAKRYETKEAAVTVIAKFQGGKYNRRDFNIIEIEE